MFYLHIRARLDISLFSRAPRNRKIKRERLKREIRTDRKDGRERWERKKAVEVAYLPFLL